MAAKALTEDQARARAILCIKLASHRLGPDATDKQIEDAALPLMDMTVTKLNRTLKIECGTLRYTNE